MRSECQLVIASDTRNLSAVENADAAHCLGYLAGASDTLNFWEDENRELKTSLKPPACLPREATMSEFARVVIKFLEDHPNQLHHSYGTLVMVALHEGYPCKDSKR